MFGLYIGCWFVFVWVVAWLWLIGFVFAIGGWRVVRMFSLGGWFVLLFRCLLVGFRFGCYWLCWLVVLLLYCCDLPRPVVGSGMF